MRRGDGVSDDVTTRRRTKGRWRELSREQDTLFRNKPRDLDFFPTKSALTKGGETGSPGEAGCARAMYSLTPGERRARCRPPPPPPPPLGLGWAVRDLSGIPLGGAAGSRDRASESCRWGPARPRWGPLCETWFLDWSFTGSFLAPSEPSPYPLFFISSFRPLSRASCAPSCWNARLAHEFPARGVGAKVRYH